MSLLSLNAVGVTTNRILFSDLDFTLSAGERVGLVAANGRGKSSLLHCLAGQNEPSSGQITFARGTKVALVPQAVPDALLGLPLRDAVLTGLAPDLAEYESWRADIVLADLGVPTQLQGRTVSALSGGWQRVMLIARAWIAEPDILLLDEPTNHLDLSRIFALEAFLIGPARTAGIVVASHDRAFLDAVTTRTLFLRATRSVQFTLPYGAARAALDTSDAADARAFDKTMKESAQLRRQAAKLNNIGINSGSDLLVNKTKQLKARAERLEEAARPAHKEESAGNVRLANRGTHAKVLVTLQDAAIATPDDRVLFTTGERRIAQGDRVVLLGANGIGKSRLIGALADAMADPGKHPAIRITPSLVLGHSDQHLGQIAPKDSPMALITRFSTGDQKARALLADAGVSIEMQERPAGALSLGQRARVALLMLRLAEPNFYLLDEPTNHLDIEGQESLEAELLAGGATSVIVSHDRRFVASVGNRFWRITGRGIIEEDGPDAFFASMKGVGT